MKDSFDNEVRAGDTIAYAVAGPRGLKMRKATVLEVRSVQKLDYDDRPYLYESLFVDVPLEYTDNPSYRRYGYRVVLTNPTFTVLK